VFLKAQYDPLDAGEERMTKKDAKPTDPASGDRLERSRSGMPLRLKVSFRHARPSEWLSERAILNSR
jgi:hypothetical protein